MVQTTPTRPASRPRVRGQLTPSLDELREWLADRPTTPKTVPIFCEIMADTETPVSAFLKIRTGDSSFMLESIEGGERIARYSFLGSGSILELSLRDGLATITTNGETREQAYTDPLTILAESLDAYHSDTIPGLPLP